MNFEMKPNPTRSKRTLVALFAALALVAAACGGGSESPTASVQVEPADTSGAAQSGDSETDGGSGDLSIETDDADLSIDSGEEDESNDPAGAPDRSASTLGADIRIMRYFVPFVPPITLPDVSVLGETGAVIEGSLGDFAEQGSGLDVVGAECAAGGGELVYNGTDDSGSFFNVEGDGSGTYEQPFGPDGNIEVTVNADGSGTYDLVHGTEGNISIEVNADGSGSYEHIFGEDGNVEIQVEADGSGVYERVHGDAGNVEVRINQDGSGSYKHLFSENGNIELIVNADGTGSYEHTFSEQGNIEIEVAADGSRRYEQTFGPDGNIEIVVNPDGSGFYDHFDSEVEGNVNITVDSDGNGVFDQTFGPNGNVTVEFTTDIGILDPQLVVIGSEPTFAVADQFPPLAKLASLSPPCATVIRLDSSVLFDFDSAELRPAADEVIAELADALIANGQPLEVHGHTDARGDDAYNQDLSERRAQSFAAALEAEGVTSSIGIVGFGESRPAAPNENADGSDNPVGRQLNRRIEVVIGG